MGKIYDIPDWVTSQTYNVNREYTRKIYQRIPDWVNARYDKKHYGMRRYARKAAKVMASLIGALFFCLLLCGGIR
ncbi:hypothetical protein [uncultured Megasphaera sp.]|uniref:hypothetical protein n=1 Tax=uncultured Megasphaera sp. TaxID=165188 RepID=UPI0025990B89|nr:hypothetical protein [uncultured Megasphaera sp.]